MYIYIFFCFFYACLSPSGGAPWGCGTNRDSCSTRSAQRHCGLISIYLSIFLSVCLSLNFFRTLPCLFAGSRMPTWPAAMASAYLACCNGFCLPAPLVLGLGLTRNPSPTHGALVGLTRHSIHQRNLRLYLSIISPSGGARRGRSAHRDSSSSRTAQRHRALRSNTHFSRPRALIYIYMPVSR